MPRPGDVHATRARIVELLSVAAQIEHAVCCQYLFAAYSMKGLPGEPGCSYAQLEQLRRWKGTVLSIARMEMEHLAIVNNLLTAIGELAQFQRPGFPTAPGAFPVDHSFSLRAFGLETLGDFALIEFPDHPTAIEHEFVQFLDASPLPADQALARRIGDGRQLRENSLSALYEELVALLRSLDAAGATALFVGASSAQVTGTTLFPTTPPQPPNVRIYDVLVTSVTDKSEAIAAVEQIRREGEGSVSRAAQDAGHFARFVGVYEELSLAQRADEAFVPSRLVVDNPVAGPRTAAHSPFATVVERTTAIHAMQAYDLAYDACLRLLSWLFTQAPGDPGYLVLQDIVFFPMMTLVLRPLGDLLTLLPAFDHGDERAGPSFLAPPSIALARPMVAWSVLGAELDELAARCAALAARPDLEGAVAGRLAFLAENAWRLAKNFSDRAALVGQS